MRKIILTFLTCIVFIGLAAPVTASADMGPKPSVVVDITGLEGQTYYVTLLSDVESTGPYSSLEFILRDNPHNLDPKEYYYGADEDYPAYLKFIEYADPDGFHFLGHLENCSQTHRYTWGYHPPMNFKILVYFPDDDTFAVSEGIYERYAFDSYYRADLTGLTQIVGDGAQLGAEGFGDGTAYFSAERYGDSSMSFSAERSYDYGPEVGAMLARIVLTILIELLIALLFAFRHKKQIIFILVVNLITQISLNVALNVVGILHGMFKLVALYILLELLIIIIEAVAYTVYLRKYSERDVPRWKPITYAITANAASFGAGLLLVNVLPGLF